MDLNSKQLDRFVYAFTAFKLIIHLLTNSNYGLHRDEYLYYADGQHLAWGYMEVPPFTPFIAWISSWFGGSPFAMRLFPALAGALIVYLTGKLVKNLGGGIWAITFACLGLILAPALSFSNSLFQPVSFNQLFWFLTAYALIKYLDTKHVKYAVALGIIIGLGLLNKYSIIFYVVGLILGLLCTAQRKILISRHFLIAAGIALVLFTPNLWWQVEHNLPVIKHMNELRDSQLSIRSLSDFLIPLLYFFAPTLLVWVFGLWALNTVEKFRSYRSLSWALLFTVAIIGLLNGKEYYVVGAFLILFAFGGLYLENILKPRFRIPLLVLMFVAYLPVVPLSLPVLGIENMEGYCSFLIEKVGFEGPMRWEDGKIHRLPQDFADMVGWEEMVQKVSKHYHALPEEVKTKCMIYGGSYGHAGSLNYFRKKYDLPEAYSMNTNFLTWAPDSLDFNNQFLIDDVRQDSSRWFHFMELIDSVEHPYARDPGLIYYRKNPKQDPSKVWTGLIRDAKAEFNF